MSLKITGTNELARGKDVVSINQLDGSQPIYLQIKQLLEDSILDGAIEAGERIPSTNELAKFYKINPATARQGVNELVQEGIVLKRRGVGMFVSEKGRDIVLEKRKTEFYESYIIPLKKEANKLAISEDQLMKMISEGGITREN